MSESKSPLHLYVVWHSDFREGQNLADAIFTRFCRNVDKPTQRGLGMPVFFRILNPKKSPPPHISYKNAARIAVVFLIDSYAKLDDAWNRYASDTVKELKNKPGGLFIPVVFNNSIKKNLPPCFAFYNVIDLIHSKKPDQSVKLCSHITHEICRLLSRDLSQPFSPGLPGQPVKVFLSHTKRDDSLELVEKLRQYLATQTQLNSFLDVNSIPYGSEFAQVIESNSAHASFIIIHSDSFSASYWCQFEILLAKQFNRPIVVLDALKNREERAFPYLGNTPVIRYEDNREQNAFFFSLLDRLLQEVLAANYQNLAMLYKIQLFVKDPNRFKILSEPPELLTLHHLLKSGGSEDAPIIVLYPDPPLLKVEMETVQACFPQIRFTTPNFLFSLEEKPS